MSFLSIILSVIGVITLGGILLSCLIIVDEKDAVIIERFGKFNRVMSAGLRFKLPAPIELIAARKSLRIEQVSQVFDVKTNDNVFLKLPIHMQLQIEPGDVANSFYALQDPEHQISAYVLAHARAAVNEMDFKSVYNDKSLIERRVKDALEAKMKEYGYTVINVLVDEPDPGKDIKQSYNSVISSKRELEATENKANAEKVMKVRNAEAEAEASKLAGQGISDQRREIVEGMKESITDLREAVPGLTEKEATSHLMQLFQLETIKSVGEGASNTILLAINDGQSQTHTQTHTQAQAATQAALVAGMVEK